MTYALIELQTEEKLFQRILIDPMLTLGELNIIQQIIERIQAQIEEILFILS